MSVFKDLLGPEKSAQIIVGRMAQLADEGYQHELNLEYLKVQLQQTENDDDAHNIAHQIDQAAARIADLETTINWHEEQFNKIKGIEPVDKDES